MKRQCPRTCTKDGTAMEYAYKRQYNWFFPWYPNGESWIYLKWILKCLTFSPINWLVILWLRVPTVMFRMSRKRCSTPTWNEGNNAATEALRSLLQSTAFVRPFVRCLRCVSLSNIIQPLPLPLRRFHWRRARTSWQSAFHRRVLPRQRYKPQWEVLRNESPFTP